MSLKKILLEFNITDSEKVLEQMLAKIGHTIEPLDYYIDSGGYGDVFKVKGKNKVLKITTSFEEANKINELVGKKFDHVANFYMVKKLSSGLLPQAPNQELWLIVSEFLDNPNLSYNYIWSMVTRKLGSLVYYQDDLPDKVIDYKKDLLRYVKSINMSKLYINALFGSISKIQKKIDDYAMKGILINIIREMKRSNRGVIQDFIKTFQSHENMLPDIVKGLEELREEDIFHDDLHLGNILIDPKTKNYKVIDIN